MLLNMKCRSLGMSTLFRSEYLLSASYSCFPVSLNEDFTGSSHVIDVSFDALIYITMTITLSVLEKLIFVTSDILYSHMCY